MKKIIIFLSILIIFFFPLSFVSGQFDDIEPDQVNLEAIGFAEAETSTQTTITGEHIKTFTTLVKVEKNGSIKVTESIVYDFASMSKHGIFRKIPVVKTNQDGKKYKYNLDNIKVTDEKGKTYKYKISDLGDEVEVKIGDADILITGIHTYLISYTVTGGLTYFSDHDEIYWNATGNSWDVPIAQAVTKVDLPSEISEDKITLACYTGSTGANFSNCKNVKKSNTAYYVTTQFLSSNQGMTVVAGFPKGIVAVVEPKLVIPFSETLLGKIFFFLLMLLTTFWYVIYPFFIIFKWWKYGRDPRATVGVTTAWFDPPKTPRSNRFMTPAEVGTLGDESVDLKDISATIVDLARRGYMRIEERKKGDFYFIKSKDFGNGLLSYEKKLLTGIFASKDEIRLKDKRLYETIAEVTGDLYQNVVDEGLFPKNPSSIRTFYSVIAVLAMFTGNLFLAVVAFLFGRNMPRKTLEGVNAFNVARSLKNFLTSQERQLEFQAKNQMMFEKLLPFAIAFGVEKIWAKRFETMNIHEPDWYQGYGSTHFNTIVFTNNLNSSLSSFRSAATPPTSTRSSSGFSSGFSGGFSGGGGGGGGGGSW